MTVSLASWKAAHYTPSSRKRNRFATTAKDGIYAVEP